MVNRRARREVTRRGFLRLAGGLTLSMTLSRRGFAGGQLPVKNVVVLDWMLIGLFLAVGRSLNGRQIAHIGEIGPHLFLRAPQLIAAISVGILLAVAGGVIQSMSGNPMASPDLLGITAGGALGLTAAIFLFQPSVPGAFIGCAVGCAVSLLLLLLLGRRSSYAPEVLLLAGVSLTLLLQAVSTVVIASGDRRVMLLNLLVGSTYNVSFGEAEIAAIIAIMTLAAIPFLARWLHILPLGTSVARALGIHITAARLSLLIFSALATAAATVIIGPLSFIGLIAPHMTRLLGINKPLPLLFISASLGATLCWSPTGLAAGYCFQGISRRER